MRQTSKTRERLNRRVATRRRLFELLESRRLLAADGAFDWMSPGHWHSGWEMSYAEFVHHSPQGPMAENAYDDYLNDLGGNSCGDGDGDDPPHGPGCACGPCTASQGSTLFVERPEQAFDFIVGGGGSSGDSASAALADTFLLHSLPAANHTIYLDFDGHVTEGTTWNSQSGYSSIVSPAYDPGGNGASFTDAELAQIQGIWKRVAEDFAPFEINVTTEDPGAAALSKTGGSDAQWGSRVVVTEDWDNCGCGGFAYLTSFNDSVDEPVFVFTTSATGVSAATTHEVGHALGLSHDGTTAGAEYYNGHGSGDVGWGPIMGSGYYKNMTTWDTGQYYQANNGQDDWQIITNNNGFGFRQDDHGGSGSNFSSLVIEGTNSSDSSLSDVSGFGVISQANDQDWFEFKTGSGAINLTVDSYVQETFVSNGVGFTRSIEPSPEGDQGSNLDVLATIYDSNLNVVATSNPATGLSASFNNLSLTEGTYYIAVDGTGYGNWAANPPTGFDQSVSRGQYLIAGTVVSVDQTLNAGNDFATTQVDTPVDINVLENDSDPQNGSFSITSMTDPSNGQTSEVNGVVTYTPNAGFVGTDTFTYTITDDQAETATATVTVTVVPPSPPVLFVDDDQGQTFERFYTAALDANTTAYDTWQVSSQGLPVAADLAPYDVVVWNTGFDYSAAEAGLSTNEQVALSSYLDGGGGLFLVGQDILYNGVSSTFQTDYLKLATFTSDVRNLSQYVGVSGSSISDGMNLSFSLPSDFNADWSDSLSPTAAGEGVFYRNSVNTAAEPFNTIAYGGEDFRVVFMASPFEGISTTAGNPNNQAFVMQKVVDFLMPPTAPAGDVIVTEPTPSAVTTEAGGSVSFTVALTQEPVADVSFDVSSSNVNEGTVDVSQLTFTSGNYSVPQTVTVTGVDDSVVDGSVSYTVVLGTASTTDSNYVGLNPDDVNLTNVDDDDPVLILTLSGTEVAETGTLSATVTRNTTTGSPLIVNLASSDAGEAVVPETVTIAAGATSAEFTITGVDDSVVDGDQPATVSVDLSGYQGDSAGIIVTDSNQPALSLSLAEASISEFGGSTIGTVTRNGAGPELAVQVFSSDESEAIVGSVTIAAGATTGDFTILAVDDFIVDGDQTSTISVGAAGYVGASEVLTVTDNEVARLSVTIATTDVAEGSTTTAVVTRNTGTSGELLVTLSSSDFGEASVPATVTIADGQDNVEFAISGVEDGIVDGDQTATITASVAGYVPGNEVVTVVDTDGPTLALTFSASSVSEAGGVITATLSRNTSSSASLEVAVSNDDPTAASVPAAVTIPAGQSSVTFEVTGVDDDLVDGDQTAVITASAGGFVAGSASVLVVDDDIATLSLNIDIDSISEADGSTTAILSRNTPTDDPLVVQLQSSDESEATVPASVTIPAGGTSVTVEISIIDDQEYDGTQNVVVTATVDGFVAGVDSFDVTDDDPPPPDPLILFVDDDQGAAYERFYTAALDANALNHDTWDVNSQGLPTASDLSDYLVVVWNTGFEYSAAGSGLATAEQALLSAYLDGGGGLFLVGQDILYNGVSSAFQSDYLKLSSFTSDARNLSQYVGVSGSAISDGMNLSFSLPSDFSADWSDALAPAPAAEGVFYRNSVNNESQPFNTIAYGGEDFRVVFMASPFEGISASAGNPNNQAFVMDKVIGFLMPPAVATGDVIVSEPTPSAVTTEAGGAVQFTVALTEAPTADVSFSVSSSNVDEGTVDVGQLVFTPSDWSSPQTVTVTGVDDSVVDGDVGYSIILGVSSTTDFNYAGLDPDDVALDNADDDSATLTLDLGDQVVAEGSTLGGVVSRNTDTGLPLTVNLGSSDVGEASVTATVTIPAGSSSAQFLITGIDDAFVDGDQQVLISTELSGYAGASGTVTVVDATVPALSLALADAAISENGGATTGTVTRNGSGDAVTLVVTSSDPSEALVGSLTIAAGETTGTFEITAQDDADVDGDQEVVITVDAGGYTADSEVLTVIDDEAALLIVSIAPSDVAEGTVATGTVERNTGTVGALVVTLSSSDDGEASVPTTVTIQDGQSSAQFVVTGVEDGFVDGNQTVDITGSSDGFNSGVGIVSVLDVDVPTLIVEIVADEVAENGVVTATVTRNTDTGTALTVDLASTDSQEAYVSPNVVIPTGAASATFDVYGQIDGIVDGTQTVLITANATDFVQGSDSIDVTDIDFEETDLFYFSRKNSGNVDGVLFQNEDIVAYDGNEFRVFFDGTPWVSGYTLDAFYIQDNGDILMSYSVAGSVSGASLSFDDSDIVKFSPSTQTWEMYFDGSDVGLTSNGEDVDSIGFAPDGRLVISTSGSSSTNGLSSRDEDIIVFNQSSLGANTDGSFEMYFDGSDVGLSTSSGEDVDAISITRDGTIYMSTVGSFSVTGISGRDEDVFVFEPSTLGSSTSGTFRPELYFDGSAYGFGNDVGGLQVANPPGSGSGNVAAAPGPGSGVPDGLMVLMDWEPEVPVSAPAEVVGPLTFAQWKSLANSESALETVTAIKQPTSNDKVSEEETLLMCLDEVLAEWGI
jgi:hypothetical protein